MYNNISIMPLYSFIFLLFLLTRKTINSYFISLVAHHSPFTFTFPISSLFLIVFPHRIQISNSIALFTFHSFKTVSCTPNYFPYYFFHSSIFILLFFLFIYQLKNFIFYLHPFTFFIYQFSVT